MQTCVKEVIGLDCLFTLSPQHFQDETDKVVANLREDISMLRERVTQSSSNKEEVMTLQELVRELQIAKQQTWEEKQKLSVKFEEERKTNLANRVSEYEENARKRVIEQEFDYSKQQFYLVRSSSFCRVITHNLVCIII